MAWSVARHTFDAVQVIDEDRAGGIVTTAVRLGPLSAVGSPQSAVVSSTVWWSVSTVCFALVNIPVAVVNALIAGWLLLLLLLRRDPTPNGALRLYRYSIAFPYAAGAGIQIGAGIGGLNAAALLARAGHHVTVLDGNDWVGGKSRHIGVGGQRIDTGPSLVTFPAVWDELLRRYGALGAGDTTGDSSVNRVNHR